MHDAKDDIDTLRAEVDALRRRFKAQGATLDSAEAEVRQLRGQRQEALAEAQRLQAIEGEVRAMLDAEDARVAEINDRHEAEGDISPKTGRPYKVVGIVTTRNLRAILDGKAVGL